MVSSGSEFESEIGEGFEVETAQQLTLEKENFSAAERLRGLIKLDSRDSTKVLCSKIASKTSIQMYRKEPQAQFG
jgi:hypothetical protein